MSGSATAANGDEKIVKRSGQSQESLGKFVALLSREWPRLMIFG